MEEEDVRGGGKGGRGGCEGRRGGENVEGI